MTEKTSTEISAEISPENNLQFNEGDTITCPSDLTDSTWEITNFKDDGTIIAKCNPHQDTSKTYPEKIEIIPEAQNKWKKVE